MSNLIAQLDAAGLSDRVDAVLHECSRVREELGWPIMVTPFSQLVGVQATLNVIEGERYARVPDEVKKYAFGYYGRLLAPVAPDVLDRISAHGSAAISERPPERAPIVPELQADFPNASPDELLLRSAFAPHVLVDPVPEQTAHAGEVNLGALVNALATCRGMDRVTVRTNGLNVTLSW